uniref:Lipocalin n=1 Tax=Rhipicephalus zambeziensis TaxID=60191 RepID=A0A224YGZ4_9ACAR
MHLQLIVSVLYCSISVPTLCNLDADYDSYEYEEVSTTPTSKIARKPTKKQIRNEVYSIEEFLNTTERIWVYKSTRRLNMTCSADVMLDVNMFYANMTRYEYSLSDGLTNITAQAFFDFHPLLASSEDPYNEMRIRNTDRNAWFELRLWNSSLDQGPDKKCLTLFNEYTSLLTLTYNYTPSCQCIIPRRSEKTTADENLHKK